MNDSSLSAQALSGGSLELRPQWHVLARRQFNCADRAPGISAPWPHRCVGVGWTHGSSPPGVVKSQAYRTLACRRSGASPATDCMLDADLVASVADVNQDHAVQINEVHRAIGAIVAAATNLELNLVDAVVALSRSPLTRIVVQGERGNTLIGMGRRLLDRGVGSHFEDEVSGRSARLGLVSAADTSAFREALADADIDSCAPGMRSCIPSGLPTSNRDSFTVNAPHGPSSTCASGRSTNWSC